MLGMRLAPQRPKLGIPTFKSVYSLMMKRIVTAAGLHELFFRPRHASGAPRVVSWGRAPPSDQPDFLLFFPVGSWAGRPPLGLEVLSITP